MLRARGRRRKAGDDPGAVKAARRGAAGATPMRAAMRRSAMIAAMPALGLNHYNLRAPRELMETLRAFYVEVVGLQPGPRPPFPSIGHWLYAGGRPVLHLSLASPAEARTTGARTTFDHVAFDCSGRAGYEALLDARGIAFEVARVAGTTQVQVFFDDPAGNGVELDFPGDDA